MKKIWIMLLVLLNVICVAQAEFELPMESESRSTWLRCSVAWQEGIASYAPREETMYLAGADDVFRRYPAILDDAPVQEALVVLEKRMDAAGIDVGAIRIHNPDLITDGETLWGVSGYSGTVFQVTFSEGQAVFTAAVVLDILPEKPEPGFCTVIGAAMDSRNVYLLVQSSNRKQDNITSALYAYDRQTWERRQIPVALPEDAYAGDVTIYKEGIAFISAIRRSDWSLAALLAVDMNTGSTRLLSEELNVRSLPENAAVLTCDGARELIILGQRDLIYALSPRQGLKAIGRLSDYGFHAVIHPDGRVLIIGSDAVLELDADREMTIQTISLLTDGIYGPDESYNTEIPDISVITTESRELMGDHSAADQFASDMTTQSDRWDVYILPISEAEQIAKKGYYIPITGEQAESFLADLHPFVREQVINGDGELMMIPIGVYRRDTIAYDPRAAALLGI